MNGAKMTICETAGKLLVKSERFVGIECESAGPISERAGSYSAQYDPLKDSVCLALEEGVKQQFSYNEWLEITEYALGHTYTELGKLARKRRLYGLLKSNYHERTQTAMQLLALFHLGSAISLQSMSSLTEDAIERKIHEVYLGRMFRDRMPSTNFLYVPNISEEDGKTATRLFESGFLQRARFRVGDDKRKKEFFYMPYNVPDKNLGNDEADLWHRLRKSAIF